MASQGPFAPASTGVLQTFDALWNTPVNAYTDNAAYATGTTLNLFDQTDTQGWCNFGFTIPGSATIDGIVVELNDVTAHTFGTSFLSVSQDDFSIPGTIEDLFSVPGWVVYGSPVSLWGMTWTPAQINSSTLFNAVVFAVGGANLSDTTYVDAIRVTVYYTDAGGQDAYPDADLDASTWTTAPLWSKVDEPTTPSDADFITSTST